jgi:immune inhibitor A
MKQLFLGMAITAALLSGASSEINGASESGAGAAVSGKNGAGHAKPLPPFVVKREKERLEAAELVARGQATADENGIVTLKNGRFVRYRLQGTEFLTAVLIDFTDVRHGQIAEPDRSTDNSTYWSADVSPQHYYDMLFAPGGATYARPSMRDFYLEQSSGRFTWEGQVSNWTAVNATESAFGANARRSGAGGDDANGPAYRVVDAALKGLAASGNYGGLDLARADQVDRYDCDGDGVFAEPDGYIDHLAIVHAGQGASAAHWRKAMLEQQLPATLAPFSTASFSAAHQSLTSGRMPSEAGLKRNSPPPSRSLPRRPGPKATGRMPSAGGRPCGPEPPRMSGPPCT